MDKKAQTILLWVIAAVVFACGSVYLNDKYEEHCKTELLYENYKRAANSRVNSPGVKLP